ncbi:MAG: ankyrin repeat domain-containing protein [Gammaproteobacteria bacterium]
MLSLADAIIQENVEQVRDSLRYGINLNEIDEYGFTPLIEAAIADNVAIGRMLIHSGANVNLQDSVGGTALHWAVENNNLDFCRLLLENGANPNSYNLAGQPVLVMPLLRQQKELKKLLQSAGANLDFTQDYINTKFLGHLFELVGTADIIDPSNQFVEVDFEGFYLEVTLGMIAESLAQFNMHFAGRQIRRYSELTQVIISVLQRATQLIKYQQYRIDINNPKYDHVINNLLQQEPYIIPVGYEGHAITFIKLGKILVKCDRREDSRLYDNIMLYHINNNVFSTDLVKSLIYEKQTSEAINEDLPALLDLKPITELKVPAQISGNCSWANVEACIPALYFLLFSNAKDFQANIPRYKSLALDFFNQWREWNKDRSLNFCIQSFNESDSIRKATKAEILAAILYQCCGEDTPKNRERIEMILSVLATPQFEHVLKNYIQVYSYEDQSPEGKNFLNVIKSFGYLNIG